MHCIASCLKKTILLLLLHGLAAIDKYCSSTGSPAIHCALILL